MSESTPTGRLHELIEALQRTVRELESGTLTPEGLDQAAENARGLFERFVVLRHKAREASLRPTADHLEPPPVIAPPELPSLRLDTRPTEVSPRQTSLIDAIAETETKPARKAPAVAKQAPPEPPSAEAPAAAPVPKPRTTKPAEAPKGPSLADKLEHAPVADLHKAIALSQKFWFVAELFGGQRERYEKAIDSINAMGSLEEARTFVANEVLAKVTGRPPAEEAVQAFSELVQRRFH